MGDKSKVEKYDMSYRRESEATIIATILVVINVLVLTFSSCEYLRNNHLYRFIALVGSLVWRIIVTFWVVSIAARQNRSDYLWGVFAFLLPNLALINIGLLRKLNIEITEVTALSGQTEEDNIKYL